MEQHIKKILEIVQAGTDVTISVQRECLVNDNKLSLAEFQEKLDIICRKTKICFQASEEADAEKLILRPTKLNAGFRVILMEVLRLMEILNKVAIPGAEPWKKIDITKHVGATDKVRPRQPCPRSRELAH